MTTANKAPQADEALKAGKRVSEGKVTPLGRSNDASLKKRIEEARAEIRAFKAAVNDEGPEVLTAAELRSQYRNAPGVDWLIDGIVPRGTKLLLAAESRVGKTWALLEQAIAISSGSRAFGEFKAKKGRVLLELLEDAPKQVGARLEALADGRDDSGVIIRCRKSINLADDLSVAALLERVRRYQIDLVCIDHLRAAHLVEENSSSEMAPVLENVRALQELSGAVVQVTHHHGRPSRESAARRASLRSRGSTAIGAAFDGTISLELRGLPKTADDGVTTTILGVDVELRGEISVGAFGLERVTTGGTGYATSCFWRYSRDQLGVDAHEVRGGTKESRFAETLTKMRAALDRRAAVNPSEYVPLETLRKELKIGREKALSALLALRGDRFAEQGLGERGWRRRIDDGEEPRET